MKATSTLSEICPRNQEVQDFPHYQVAVDQTVMELTRKKCKSQKNCPYLKKRGGGSGRAGKLTLQLNTSWLIQWLRQAGTGTSILVSPDTRARKLENPSDIISFVLQNI